MEQQWDQLGLTLSQTYFTYNEATAAITPITDGDFPFLQRLFTQIEPLLQNNDLGVITKEVVEAARESLMIGPL